MNISSVLCVCTGNICRSPLAQGLLKREVPRLVVASAGIGALAGAPMDPSAAAIAIREGLPIENHRGRQITRAMARDYDLTIVMEAGQKKWIIAKFPESRGRVFLASHWQNGEDVADPYRLSDNVFEAVYQQLESCMADWGQRLST